MRKYRAVAPARVIVTIGSHGADQFVFGNLVQQIWQDGAVTVSADGKLDRMDVGCSRVHGQPRANRRKLPEGSGRGAMNDQRQVSNRSV